MLDIIQFTPEIIGRMEENLCAFFQGGGISEDSAKVMADGCISARKDYGETVFLKAVRACCEELKLSFNTLVEDAEIKTFDNMILTEEKIENLQDYI